MERADVIVVGGGLSGLALAHRLTGSGVAVRVLEARERLGGRILTRSTGGQGAHFDLGPAWIWPHNHRMLRLVSALGLTTFEQYATGRLVYQDASGAIRRDLDFAPMAGALRVLGGLGMVIERLASALPPTMVQTGHKVHRIDVEDDRVVVHAETGNGAALLQGQHVILALPPRVAIRDITFKPALAAALVRHFADTPTWMAAHAKLMAVYHTPFWRKNGLSGDAMSQMGPLGEIHDASPAGPGMGALFGFVGVPATARQDEAAVRRAALSQMVQLFGQDAASPIAVFWEDWARAPETATEADWQPPSGHPHYHRPPDLDAQPDARLHFAGTELAPEEGGFLEGALAAADHVLARLSP